jgi:hypothetical protein
VEAKEDGRNINIVTQGGSKTGTNTMKLDTTQHQWVKKSTEPHKSLTHEKKMKHLRRLDMIFLKKNCIHISLVAHSELTNV